jgi:hypothetical protein
MALRPTHAESASWETGILATQTQLSACFIPPPVDGWTFAIGLGYFPEPRAGSSQFLTIIQDLSTQFGDVYYFGSHRVSSYYAWAIARQGKVVRVFACADSELFEHGNVTPEELAIGYTSVDTNFWADEEHVVQLAAAWTIDALLLDQRTTPQGPGWLLRIPRPT